MTSTLTRASDERGPAAARTIQLTLTLDELRDVADGLGQMELSDPRWSRMEPVLDACLRSAGAHLDGPRASVWRAIARDVSSPLVVKLRTLSLVLQETTGSTQAGSGPPG